MHIVFVKIGAIGDLIMSLPTMRTARREHPTAQLTLVVGRSLLPLAKLVEEIDQLVLIDDHALYRGNRLQQLRALAACAWQLRWRKVDRLLIGHSDRRYQVFARMVRARRVDSWQRGAGRQFPVPGRLHADEYLRLYHGIDRAEMPASVPYTLDQRLPLPDRLTHALTVGKPLVALAPGGARNLWDNNRQRRWPLEHYAELARQLIEADCQVLLTGGPTDDWVREAFSGLPIEDLVGQTDLPALIALYQRCDLVITHDSGPLHLAGLAGVKRLALFGATHPDEKIREDAYSRVIWLGRDMACSPCYDGRTYADCQTVRCLADLTPERVLHMAQTMLKENE
jgi:heptosyltransferase-2